MHTVLLPLSKLNGIKVCINGRARFGGLRVSGLPSPSEQVPSMSDVELMQGRMKSLRRSPSSQ